MTDETAAALRTLLRAISDLRPDTPVHADTVREAFEAAQLKPAERSGAFKAACRDGYLRVPHDHLPDGSAIRWSVQSRHEGRKGAYSLLYSRTAKAVPEHVCAVEVG